MTTDATPYYDILCMGFGRAFPSVEHSRCLMS
jgi:hypothetical protein